MALNEAALNPTNKVVKVHAGVYQPKAAGQALVWFNRSHNGIRLEAVGTVTLSAANPKIAQTGTPGCPALVNHVVYFGDGIDNRTTVQGFRITGANHFVTMDPPELEPNARFKKDLFFYGDGGAIKIFGNSSPTLSGLEIVNNYASPCAGGVSVQQQWAPEERRPDPVRMYDCVLRENRSQITGAAVDLLPGSSAVISNCLFVGNMANLGVNFVSANQAQPEFTNSAPLTVFPGSHAVVLQCTFTGNRNGVEDIGGPSVYENCVFWGNTRGGAYYGGARYDLKVEDAQVKGCFFGGPVLDEHGVVSRSGNELEAPDPKFDEELRPTAREYARVGARAAFSLTKPEP